MYSQNNHLNRQLKIWLLILLLLITLIIIVGGLTRLTDSGQKLYYGSEEPQIYLSKDENIKVLNFGWRCYYLEGAELNFKVSQDVKRN